MKVHIRCHMLRRRLCPSWAETPGRRRRWTCEIRWDNPFLEPRRLAFALMLIRKEQKILLDSPEVSAVQVVLLITPLSSWSWRSSRQQQHCEMNGFFPITFSISFPAVWTECGRMQIMSRVEEGVKENFLLLTATFDCDRHDCLQAIKLSSLIKVKTLRH